jgi:hypothetical protein
MFMVMTKIKKPDSPSAHEIFQLRHTRVVNKEISK